MKRLLFVLLAVIAVAGCFEAPQAPDGILDTSKRWNPPNPPVPRETPDGLRPVLTSNCTMNFLDEGDPYAVYEIVVPDSVAPCSGGGPDPGIVVCPGTLYKCKTKCNWAGSCDTYCDAIDDQMLPAGCPGRTRTYTSTIGEWDWWEGVNGAYLIQAYHFPW